MIRRFREHWRISAFRLAILSGAVFIIGNMALLGLIYWQTTGFLERRIDKSIETMSTGFTLLTPEEIPRQINAALTYDLRKSNIYALFSSDFRYITGNLSTYPGEVRPDGKLHQFASRLLPEYAPDGAAPGQATGAARALAKHLSNGNWLIVGRDFTQLAEIKAITLHALLGSGALIILLGLGSGYILSVKPIRRISAIRATSQRIIQGELSLRMPVSGHDDELDTLCTIVNLMLDEIERLLTEVKSVTDTLAHDLRSPLTRLRLILQRVQQLLAPQGSVYALLDNALGETDALLGRFRALLRISEIENGRRKAGFTAIDPREVIDQITESFEALAEDKGVSFEASCTPTRTIHADPELLFEAVSNLVDNAIKFTPAGGGVVLKLGEEDQAVRIDILDTGSGIAPAHRSAVLQRFYRAHPDAQDTQGCGIGLSIVTAICHLHGFRLEFQDSPVGTHVTVYCAQ